MGLTVKLYKHQQATQSQTEVAIIFIGEGKV